MNMELITSAASDALVNVALAIIAYGVYYIRLGAAKLKEQTAQIKDETGRKVLEDALDDVVNLATVSVGAMEQTTAKALRDAVKNGTASREELLARVNALNPTFCEMLPLTLEEIFINETEVAGYDVKKLLF